MPSQIDDETFTYLQTLAEELTGIRVEPSKRKMLYARLSRRVRELGFENFSGYTARLKQGDRSELEDFTNRVTTNLTHFFREPGHFRYLREQVMPQHYGPRADDRPFRVWSAGCSTGQEPYSIAMTLGERATAFPQPPKILCTDINTEVLSVASEGRFSRDALRGLADNQLRRWFEKLGPKQYRAKQQLRDMMIFKPLNLFSRWPIRGSVDAIFCRNVLIYFDTAAQESLITRFADLLAPGGHLFLGHSETITAPKDNLSRVATTIYQKDAGG